MRHDVGGGVLENRRRNGYDEKPCSKLLAVCFHNQTNVRDQIHEQTTLNSCSG